MVQRYTVLDIPASKEYTNTILIVWIQPLGFMEIEAVISIDLIHQRGTLINTKRVDGLDPVRLQCLISESG